MRLLSIPIYPPIPFFVAFHITPLDIGVGQMWDILLSSSNMETTCNQDFVFFEVNHSKFTF